MLRLQQTRGYKPLVNSYKCRARARARKLQILLKQSQNATVYTQSVKWESNYHRECERERERGARFTNEIPAASEFKRYGLDEPSLSPSRYIARISNLIALN